MVHQHFYAIKILKAISAKVFPISMFFVLVHDAVKVFNLYSYESFIDFYQNMAPGRIKTNNADLKQKEFDSEFKKLRDKETRGDNKI